MCFVKKLIFVIHSKKSNNHEHQSDNIMTIPQFLSANFQEVNYNERVFIAIFNNPVFESKVDCNERACITLKEKKKILDVSITFSARYFRKNINIVNEKLTQTLAKNLLFFYNTTQKNSSLHTNLIYKKCTHLFIFTQECTFAERCCFPTFSFEGKFRKYDISVTKTN